MIRAVLVGRGRWGRHLAQCAKGSDKILFTAQAGRDGYERILNDKSVDAVVLATPHSLHAEQVIAAARAGKHVFTEKPFALTRASAEAALAACAAAGVTLAVGYNWRFQPALLEIAGMLRDGRLGRLLHIEGNFCGPSAYRFDAAHWRQSRDEGPAGGMTGRGVHLVDAMLFLSGPIRSVFAQSRRSVKDSGLDDTTSMLFEFASGATGYLGTVIATAETWRLQVLATNGWAEVGGVEHLNTWTLRFCLINKDNPFENGQVQTVTFPPISTERAELEHFAAAAAARRPLAVAGGDELHGVEVLEAIVSSAKLRATVRIGS